MSGVSSYLYNKDGLNVKYTLETIIDKWDVWDKWHSSWIETEDIPADFMPLPEFEKRNFFQTFKYRICNMDLFGKKERRQQQEMIHAHEDKRVKAWAQKKIDDKKKREQEIVEACEPEKLRATGVDKLLQQIKNAKNIDIKGTRYYACESPYQDVEFSRIDDIEIDLALHDVRRNNSVVFKIPELQLRSVYQAINDWRNLAIKQGKRIK